MRKHVASHRERAWAVEGSNGAGRPFGAAAAGRRRTRGRRPGEALRGLGRWTPGTTARPTPTTRTPSRCVPRLRCWPKICCGCWSTDAPN
jgi:hypothetical protein